MDDVTADMAVFEKNIGYVFADKKFLDRALTRKAYALEQKQQNCFCEDQEIYRTLGDAVLKAVLVDLLIRAGSRTREEITLNKKELESEEALARLGNAFSLGTFIKLGIGEQKQRAAKVANVIAETLEAVVGAIYLDAGYTAVMDVIAKWFNFAGRQ